MRIRHALFVLAAAPMLVVPTPAARATTAGAAVFQGTMTTGPLLLPCFPTIGDCPGTAPVTVVTITGTDFLVPIGGAAVGFSLSTTICLGGAAVSKPGVTTVPAPLCAITAAGVVAGHCGLSHGAGVLSVTVAGLMTYTATAPFQWFELGGARVITSDPIPTMGMAVVGTMYAVPIPTMPAPPIPANTCTTAATDFFVHGSAAFVDVT